MFCPNCGQDLAQNAVGHCPRCGQPFTRAVAPSRGSASQSVVANLPPRHRRTFFRAALILSICLIGLGLFYVAAYAVLVVPTPTDIAAPSASAQPPDESAAPTAAPDPSEQPDPNPPTVQPIHRFGGPVSIFVFRPAALMDQWLFPSRWQDTLTPAELAPTLGQYPSLWNSVASDPRLIPQWQRLNRSIEQARWANQRLLRPFPGDDPNLLRRQLDGYIRQARDAQDQLSRGSGRQGYR